MRRPRQDPQGSKARAFGAWLRRSVEHRHLALRGRLTDQYEGATALGQLAIFLVLAAILVVAVLWVIRGRAS